jgi:hypothetical protein
MDVQHNDEISRKKLQPTPIKEFLKQWHRYSLNFGPNNNDIPARKMRSLLISQSYLND